MQTTISSRLAKLLGRPGEPIRFVDFSAPLRAQSGTRAVVGLLVNWAWVSDQVASLSRP